MSRIICSLCTTATMPIFSSTWPKWSSSWGKTAILLLITDSTSERCEFKVTLNSSNHTEALLWPTWRRRLESLKNTLTSNSNLLTFWDYPGLITLHLNRELARFIAAGRLHCRIDKVGGIVETNRPDSKNYQYQSTIKQGDVLLNRVQKLSRVINIWTMYFSVPKILLIFLFFVISWNANPALTLWRSFPYR